uniref:NADH-ubiquinone oxidoreductase chain 4 n=1 Tax=Strongyloides stercoralis TaxID=6248 RepID=A0A0S3M5Q4_STRER|nr:NADH dehydrogenase subunit 4 [Strongyloides stercoralis]BAT21210.1 NADH dehydrogenase subunit 4 [Strongyloides stercoralis]
MFSFLKFFFLLIFFFFYDFFFLLFSFAFCFFCFSFFCWSGNFFLIDSYFYVAVCFMSVFIFSLVLVSERHRVIVFFSKVLLVISFFFFFSYSVFYLYVFFELSMVPIIILILGYGYQIEKVNSFFYLVFYATFCSVPFLFVYFSLDFFFVVPYFDCFISWEMVFIISLAFMMKFPVFFLHLWLPKAHVEAPTSASILLAGLLLKFGTVGFVRIMKSLSYCHINYWFFFSVLGMFISCFVCVFQSDFKSLAAYSSVVHMNFLLFFLLFFGLYSKTGSFLMMVSHGYTSSVMFYFIGEFYRSLGSRMIYFLNSFMSSSFIFSFLISLVFLSNCGMPPSISFFSEFFSFSGFFSLFYNVFFLVFFYFFVSFYYCVYIIVISFLGKKFFFFKSWFFFWSLPLIFFCFNVFGFFLFF